MSLVQHRAGRQKGCGCPAPGLGAAPCFSPRNAITEGRRGAQEGWQEKVGLLRASGSGRGGDQTLGSRWRHEEGVRGAGTCTCDSITLGQGRAWFAALCALQPRGRGCSALGFLPGTCSAPRVSLRPGGDISRAQGQPAAACQHRPCTAGGKTGAKQEQNRSIGRKASHKHTAPGHRSQGSKAGQVSCGHGPGGRQGSPAPRGASRSPAGAVPRPGFT